MIDPKSILVRLNKNLNILQEREAKYAGNAPVDLLNQIADHQQAIELTQQMINGDIGEDEWQETTKSLLAFSGGEVVSIEAETYVAGDQHVYQTPEEPPFWRRISRVNLILAIVLGLIATTAAVLAVPGVSDYVYDIFSPAPFPLAIDEETLIVIATFHETAANQTEPHIKIKRAIEKVAEEVGLDTLRVEIEPSELTADQRVEAEALGNQYNASMVIWGEDTGVEVLVNFFNLKEPNFRAADIEISETERTQIATPEPYGVFITQDLPAQLTFLSLFSIGQSYYSQEKYLDAIRIIDRAVISLEENEESPLEGIADAYFLLGWLHQRPAISNLEQAIENYTTAIAFDPNRAVAYNNRGVAYSYMDDLLKAFEDYTKAVELDPIMTVAYNNRGVAYSHLGDPVRAIEDYIRAIDLTPNYSLAYNNLGFAYRINGEYEQAIESYAKVIELEPNNALAYYNRGTVYHVEGYHDWALEDFNKAIELDPDNNSVYISRGFVYNYNEEYDQAIADYTKVIQDPTADNNERYTALINRGNVYLKTGESRQAVADFEEVIELSSDPDLQRQAEVQLNTLNKVVATATAEIAAERTTTAEAIALAETMRTATAEAETIQTATAEIHKTVTAEAMRSINITRPLIPGAGIGCEGCGESSTLGYFVIDSQGKLFIISAGDLVISEVGSIVTQPSPVEGGQVPQDEIGRIAEINYERNVIIPAADMTILVSLKPGIEIDTNISNLGYVKRVRIPKIGMPVHKFGQATGLTTGQVTALYKEVDLFDPSIVHVQEIRELFISNRSPGIFSENPLSIPRRSAEEPEKEPPLKEGIRVLGAILASLEFDRGDIGALVVDNEGYAVGILIGESVIGEAVIAPMPNVLERFDVDLYLLD